MILNNIDCLGFDEAVQVDGGAYRLQRVPEGVRNEINPNAQQRVLRPACNELRCVSDDGCVSITLSSPEGEILVVPFYGCFQHAPYVHVREEPKTITVETPPRLGEVMDRLDDMPFAPKVCRLLMMGSGHVVLHKAEGAGIRPPTADELPNLRLLTYGTSITHGASATMPHLSFVRQLAWRLRADLINLGVGGACHCEHAFADYIAGRQDWDVALLSMSVNMIGAGFTPDEFQERVSYMLNTVAGANTSRPVVCVTIYPHHRDMLPADHSCQGKALPDEYRERLRRAAADCPHQNVTLLEGPDILDDIGGLTGDLIHPGDLGMIRMGENLAKRIEPLVAEKQKGG